MGKKMPLDRYPYMENNLKNVTDEPIYYEDVKITNSHDYVQVVSGHYVYYNGFVQLHLSIKLNVDLVAGYTTPIGYLDVNNIDQPQKIPKFLAGLCGNSAVGQINSRGLIDIRNIRKTDIPAGTTIGISGVYYAG